MHSKSIWRAMLLTALVALVPAAGAVRAQGEPQVFGENYAPPDSVWPLPLYSTHPEEGGLFTYYEFAIYRRTNPLKSQQVADRGFRITAPTGVDVNNNLYNFGVPSGTFIGNGAEALNVNQVSNGGGWVPGFKAGIGYRFGDGSSLTFDAFYLSDVHIHHAATLAPPGQNVGIGFADTFLFSDVFNFPSAYGGPANKVTVPNPQFGRPGAPLVVPAPGAVYGIWNGASVETIEFTQRFDQFQLAYRVPIYETETYRMSGLVGPRMGWIWERFAWRATDLDVNGIDDPQWSALYSNVVSNRMYGAHAGWSNEFYLGHGVAAKFDLEGALFADSVTEISKYELARGAFGPENKRARHEVFIVPEVEASIGLMWFPIEGVELHLGYNAMSFFNTVSSPRPIDFNYGALSPKFSNSTIRFYDGIDIGIGLVF